MKHVVLSSCLMAMVALVCATAMAAEDAPAGVVNINTATVEQLQLLPRVGPALAQRIVELREANGPFKNTAELVAVKGIGEKSLESLMPYLTVKGETTLSAKISTKARSVER